MKKAESPKEVVHFEQIPNVRKRIADDFKTLGIKDPKELAKKDPYELYVSLCTKTKSYHDPCVLDTFMAAVSFMKGKGSAPWWDFTEERKKNFKKVEALVNLFKN